MKKKSFEPRHMMVRAASDLFTPIALILGIYVILHGTVSPGGGFQGGVIVSSAAILMYLGHGYETAAETFRMSTYKKGEALAAIVYVLLAFCGVLFGANFCRNVFFHAQSTSSVFDAGTISFMNGTVGFKVLTGVSCLLLLVLGMLAPENNATDEPAELSFLEGVAPDRDDAESERDA